jgi:hypothetical protein
MHQKRAAPKGSPLRVCTGGYVFCNNPVHRVSGVLKIVSDEAVCRR